MMLATILLNVYTFDAGNVGGTLLRNNQSLQISSDDSLEDVVGGKCTSYQVYLLPTLYLPDVSLIYNETSNNGTSTEWKYNLFSPEDDLNFSSNFTIKCDSTSDAISKIKNSTSTCQVIMMDVGESQQYVTSGVWNSFLIILFIIVISGWPTYHFCNVHVPEKSSIKKDL